MLITKLKQEFDEKFAVSATSNKIAKAIWYGSENDLFNWVEEKITLNEEKRQKLFNYFLEEHNITLMDSDLNEIEQISQSC